MNAQILDDGTHQYRGFVFWDGKPNGFDPQEGFSDFFRNDEEAKAGLREIMEEQGYTVDRVEIKEGRRAEVYLTTAKQEEATK